MKCTRLIFRSTTLILLFSFCFPLFAAEDSAYNFSWLDPDKEVYVLQNRKFRKKNHLQLSAGGGMTMTGSFVDAKQFQGRLSFFVTEEFGAELIVGQVSGKENDTATSVRKNGSGSIPFRRIPKSYMGGMLLWSPFYSKINTFNKILYVDWILGAGYATLSEENNKTEVLTFGQDNTMVKESHSGPVWDIGMQLYITPSIFTRFDVTAVHYQAQGQSVSTSSNQYWYTHSEINLAIGYIF